MQVYVVVEEWEAGMASSGQLGICHLANWCNISLLDPVASWLPVNELVLKVLYGYPCLI